MKKEKETLSDNLCYPKERNIEFIKSYDNHGMLHSHKVKEFIKEVFKIVNNVPKINKIKKIAGKNLI